MHITFKGTYLSLRDVEWHDVPRFAVLTGPNGTGKSQFLDLLHRSFTKSKSPRFEIKEEAIGPQEVLFLSSEWSQLKQPSPVTFDEVQKTLDSIWAQFKAFAENGKGPPHLVALFERMCCMIGQRDIVNSCVLRFFRRRPATLHP